MESRSLLVSDVDGTLVGDDEALRRFAEWRERQRDRFLVAYASGRLISSVQQTIRETALPEPDVVIGGVGTEIWLARGTCGRQWPLGVDGWNESLIRRVMDGRGELQRQPPDVQSAWKISYFGYDLPADYLANLKQEFAGLGQHVEIVYSSDRDLDVLPPATDKGSAAAFVAEHFDVPPERVIVAGDSGNDRAMFAQPFRGIIVNNALAELKQLNGSRVYHSPFSFAAGVLDGLQHWQDTPDYKCSSDSGSTCRS